MCSQLLLYFTPNRVDFFIKVESSLKYGKITPNGENDHIRHSSFVKIDEKQGIRQRKRELFYLIQHCLTQLNTTRYKPGKQGFLSILALG
jgi:hypothetical protein